MISTLHRLTTKYAGYPLHSVIMFTDAHAHVIQMLEDPRYYKSLEEITGKDVVLFHTRLFQGRYEMPKPPLGVMCFLVPIWKEPAANKSLIALFDMKDTTSLPCLVTFSFADGEIHYTRSQIAKDSPQAAFNSIESIVVRLVKAAKESGNRVEALRKATFEMRALNFQKGLTEFLNRLGLFRGAAGI